MNQLSAMSFLPHLLLDPAWLEQSEAFHDSDPRMAKAAIKLMFAAWRGSPAASIPAAHSFIAEATGLPPEVVAERYVMLTAGFEIREDGRLHHVNLSQLCGRMISSYGKEIAAYGLAAAMAAQDQVVLPPETGVVRAPGKSAFSGLQRRSSMPQSKGEAAIERAHT